MTQAALQTPVLSAPNPKYSASAICFVLSQAELTVQLLLSFTLLIQRWFVHKQQWNTSTLTGAGVGASQL